MSREKRKLADNEYLLDIAAQWTYSIEWEKQLTEAGIGILSAVWTLETGLTEVSSVVDGTKTKIKLKADVTARRGKFYRATCEITGDDSNASKDRQSIFIEFIEQ